VYDEICCAADGGMRARVRVLRGGNPVIAALTIAAGVAIGLFCPPLGIAMPCASTTT
jgi:hypothetical protein